MAGIELDPPTDDLLEIGADAVRMLVGFLGTLDTRSAVPDPSTSSLPISAIDEIGSHPRDVLQETLRAAGDAVETAGPRHFGFIPGGGLFTSALGELLARGLNRYIPATTMAPAFAAIEREVVDWMARVLGLPGTAGGILTTGGSAATLSALLAARHDRLGQDASRGTFYITELTNHCVEKAARIAGFPASAARMVPTTPRLSMDPDALRAVIRSDKEEGRRPFMLVATAGATSTGTVDDLASLAEVAADEGLWFHVDAAYGGFFALTRRGRDLFEGLDRADSVVLDPHKSMFLPYGTGAVLARDQETLYRAHTPPTDSPPYLRDLGQGGAGPDPADLGIERSREFRGLRVWLPLRMHGVRAFRQALDEKLDLARLAYRDLSENPGLECPWPPELSTVVFRARAGNEATRALRDRINASGQAFCSGTEIRGRYHIRLCVLSFRTRREHLRAALDVIHDAMLSGFATV